MNRREFLRRSAAAGAATAAVMAGAGRLAAAAPRQAPLAMPTIRLGSLKVSRLIMGSNPFFGYAHVSADRVSEMDQYYTKERVMATLDEAAANGITAVWMPGDPKMVALWQEYRQKKGKLPIWIGQNHQGPEKMKENITEAAKNGAQAIGIQGVQTDLQVSGGHWDVIAAWVDHVHSLGLPAGIATHSPQTHLEAQKRKIPLGFHCQCLYVPDTFREEDRAKALETIRQLEKPVIAYKVLAAGRVPAKEALEFVLPRLNAKDGLCVGVYTKEDTDQIRENATYVEILSKQGRT